MTPSVTSPPSPATREALTSFDILGVIFEACLALNFPVNWRKEVQKQMALGAVCRCWRLALESLPALWSHIILVPQMPPYYIDKVVRLAKQAPKRLRIGLDLDFKLDTTFLSSIVALLAAKAETVIHISVHYWSYSAWVIFVHHLLTINPQPTFASLEKFSATPISSSNTSTATSLSLIGDISSYIDSIGHRATHSSSLVGTQPTIGFPRSRGPGLGSRTVSCTCAFRSGRSPSIHTMVTFVPSSGLGWHHQLIVQTCLG